MWVIAERVLLTLWLGSLWTTGYIVAPVLFKYLDRTTAGNVAGHLFSIVSYIGLFCLGALLIKAAVITGVALFKQRRNQILLMMLLLVVVGQFGLQPLMAELKVTGLQGASARQFAVLHGVASVLYLINSLLGLALIVQETRFKKSTVG